MLQQAIFDKKNILITGGAGFLGSHLCDRLVKKNKVICLDNFSTGSERNIDHLLSNPNFVFINHDITKPINFEDFEELNQFKIKFQGIQEIYNLACPTSPKNFLENRINIILANSEGVKNTLDLAVKYKAKFMQFSSSVVYGARKKNNNKITENCLGEVNNLSKRSSYDEGKRFAETLVSNYSSIYGINAKIVRIFRTYGPRMKLDDNQMIPDIIRDAIDSKDITILGDEYFSTSFCYVSDCIDAVTKMMEGYYLGPLNIGSDVDVNITEFAQKVISLTNSKSKIIYADKDLFITPLCIPNISKAKEELNWMPIITLDKGIQMTIHDLQASKGLLGY